MKTTLLALVLAAPLISSAQPFTVPCPATDSVLALYRDDADRLALARTYRNGTVWTDSVVIDTAWAEVAMNALVAVYNSSSPARDTVVDLLNIHIWPTAPLRSFLVTANATLPWMQALAEGSIPTGTPAIDSLLSTYGITLDNYIVFPWGHCAVFRTATNVNTLALCPLFAAQPGVTDAEPNSVYGDGDWITDSVYTDHVNLLYSHGWADCPSGCILRRYWSFNVFPDCSVDYMGSYGSVLMLPTSVSSLQLPAVRVYPNPTTDFIRLDGIGSGRVVLTYAPDGRLAGRAILQADHRMDVHALPDGIYWLHVEGDPLIAPIPFVKE